MIVLAVKERMLFDSVFETIRHSSCSSCICSGCHSKTFDFQSYLVSTFHMYALHLFYCRICSDLHWIITSVGIPLFFGRTLSPLLSLQGRVISVPPLTLSSHFLQYYNSFSVPSNFCLSLTCEYSSRAYITLH